MKTLQLKRLITRGANLTTKDKHWATIISHFSGSSTLTNTLAGLIGQENGILNTRTQTKRLTNSTKAELNRNELD